MLFDLPSQISPQFLRRVLDRVAVDPVSCCWLSSWGRVKAEGYTQVRFAGGFVLVHRLMYAAYVYGPMHPDLMVLHRCDVPPCCNPSHLFQGTHADNMADMIAKGRGNLRRPGELNGRAKLTLCAVREIRASGESQRALARQFGVSHQTIHDIRHGRRWRHAVPLN